MLFSSIYYETYYPIELHSVKVKNILLLILNVVNELWNMKLLQNHQFCMWKSVHMIAIVRLLELKKNSCVVKKINAETYIFCRFYSQIPRFYIACT